MEEVEESEREEVWSRIRFIFVGFKIGEKVSEIIRN